MQITQISWSFSCSPQAAVIKMVLLQAEGGEGGGDVESEVTSESHQLWRQHLMYFDPLCRVGLSIESASETRL